MTGGPHVAIVILSWNGKDFLRRFLPSVMSTTYSNHSIWVADNASADGTSEMLKSEFPSIKLIQNPSNEGFATGYNHALREVAADYYVLLNQDVEVTPGWLEPLVELSKTDDTIAAIQPKILAEFNKDYFEYAGAAGGFIDSFGVTFCRGRIFDKLETDKGQYDKGGEIFWASGCSLFIKADLYHSLGGLDDKFFAHMEEIDLCWRLKNAGYKIMYCPDSVVYHVGGGSLPKGHPKKSYLNFRNNLAMIIKNKPLPNILYTIPIRLMIDILASWKDLLSGDTSNFKTIVKAHWYFYTHFFELLGRRKKVNQIKKKVRIGKRNTNGLYLGSIIWAYMLRGKNKFSSLRHFI